MHVQNKKQEQVFHNKGIEYIKLHGCVNMPEEDFIFSGKSYINSIAEGLDYRFTSFSLDIQKNDFIFIGTNFNEIDIDYYLKVYEDAGFSSTKGKLFFITPNPSIILSTKISSLDGYIIKWDNKQFLDFISTLEYNPNKIQQLNKRLSYRGFSNLDDIRVAYNPTPNYSSKLYQGYEITWDDIFTEWDFINPLKDQIIREYEQNSVKEQLHCIALYGSSYVGKTCLLKRLGVEFSKKGFEVFEFNGRYLDVWCLLDYLKIDNDIKKVALLIDNASYYYAQVEILLKKHIHDKQLLVITASRTYYHKKRRYYLDGNSYRDYMIPVEIDQKFAKEIVNKLRQKGLLGALLKFENESARIKHITSKSDLISCMTGINFGEQFQTLINNDVTKSFANTDTSSNLLNTLAIFDKAEVPYLPKELVPILYKQNYISVISNPKIEGLIRYNQNGISIRNGIVTENVMSLCNKSTICPVIKKILIAISSQVSELKINYWKVMFECLLKEEILRTRFNLSNDDIKTLCYSIKNHYENISYYWLQLGLAEQRGGDFEKALNHLNQAEYIKPDAYQIQHAIGRNYLKHANSLSNLALAIPLFEQGEKRLIDLIRKKEKNQPRAFSIHCYLWEKIDFLSKFNIDVSNDEIRNMYSYLKEMIDKMGLEDEATLSITIKFSLFLHNINKLSTLKLDFNNKELVQLFIQPNKIKSTTYQQFKDSASDIS